MSLQQKTLLDFDEFFFFDQVLQYFTTFTSSFDQIFTILTRFLEHCSLIWSGVWTAAWKGISAQGQQVIENSAQNWWSMLRGSGEPDSSPNRTGTFSTSTYWWFQQPIMEMRCDVLVFILFCQKNGRKKTFDQHLFKTSGDQWKALHRLWAASQFLEVFAVLRSCLLESRNRYQGASLRIKFIQKYFISFPSPSFSPP